jgi:methyl-accepting chemotaxis protein
MLITRSIGRALGAEPDEVKQLALAVDRGELYHRWPCGASSPAGARASWPRSPR